MKRKTGRLLTVNQLKHRAACWGAVDNFERLFGSSVKVTKTRAVKHARDLNFWWAGNYLLSPKRVCQFEKFYNRMYTRYHSGKQTEVQTRKRIAAEFARLYNLEG